MSFIIHSKGVSKLKAAKELQAKLGKKILICVGDADNDVNMLDGADFSFCPSDGMFAGAPTERLRMLFIIRYPKY